jgi:hypothetical protein
MNGLTDSLLSIKMIGCRIMGGTGKGDEPEQEQGALQPELCLNGESHSTETGT